MSGIVEFLLKKRIVSLHEEISEESSKEIIEKLLLLYSENSGVEMEKILPNEDVYRPIIDWEPIKFMISTYGGEVYEALCIYDIMKMIMADCEIHTFGIGKVQSAGILLLSAGTKGKRKVSKNCQVMIHNLATNLDGNFRNLEKEVEYMLRLESTWNQKIIEETKLTEKKLKKMLEKKENLYLTAEEAIQYGIADEIL